MAKGKKTGGRQKGSRNKQSADVRAAARVFTQESIETLAAIMRTSESDQARVSAADKLLDRGWGKPAQAHTDADGNTLNIPATIAFVIQQQAGAECRD